MTCSRTQLDPLDPLDPQLRRRPYQQDSLHVLIGLNVALVDAEYTVAAFAPFFFLGRLVNLGASILDKDAQVAASQIDIIATGGYGQIAVYHLG